MSLFKNPIPILEHDSDNKAVIMPGHSTDFHFPERAVMLFMEKESEEYAEENNCEVIGSFTTITKVFPVYKRYIKEPRSPFVRRLWAVRQQFRSWNS